MGLGSTIGTGLGAIGGAFFGNPMIGASIGGSLGGMFDANNQQKTADSSVNEAMDFARKGYADLAPYRAMAMQRLQNPATYDYASAFTPQANPLFDQAQASGARALSSLDSSPDYYAQAASKLGDLNAIEDAQLQNTYRAIGQKNAALGRIGSAQVNTENSKALADSLLMRDAAKRSFLSDALNQDYANRFRKIGIASDVAGQQFGFGQAGVANRAAQLAAERAARGQDFGQGIGLAGMGSRYNPDSALFAGGNYFGRQADSSANDAGALAALAGRLWQAGRSPKSATMQSLGWGGM